MRDMRAHDIDMLTIGQYLAPTLSHLPVRRYVHPDTFKMFEAEAYKMGFTHAAVGCHGALQLPRGSASTWGTQQMTPPKRPLAASPQGAPSAARQSRFRVGR
jgi:hypothetical protein